MKIKSNVSEWLSADEIAAQQTKLVKSFHGRDTASLNATEQFKGKDDGKYCIDAVSFGVVFSYSNEH